VRGPTRGIEDTLENGAFGRNHGRHELIIRAWIPPAPSPRVGAAVMAVPSVIISIVTSFHASQTRDQAAQH
jgi:hypothetical protein